MHWFQFYNCLVNKKSPIVYRWPYRTGRLSFVFVLMRIFPYFNALDIATCFHHLYMDLFLVIDKLNLLKVWLIILLFRTYAHNPIYRFLMLAINHLSISHIVVSSWIQPLAPILLVNVDEQKPFRFIVKFCKHSVLHRYNRMSPHLHTTNFVNSCLQNFCYFRKKIFSKIRHP